MSRFRSYLYALQHDPPPVLIRKARALIGRVAYHCTRRIIDRLRGTHLSEAVFRNALKPEFASPIALIAHLRSSTQSLFSERSLIDGFEASYCTTVIAAANDACHHDFDLLGSGPVNVGTPIDWHTDFKTGHRYSPQAYYADIRPAGYPGGHDIKVPWELSRCQHLVWLGQAYAFTSDEQYAKEFVAQINSWIDANPPRFGVNWVCAMDVAIRAVNWLVALHFFHRSAAVTDNFLLKLSKSLLEHGRHIRANLEWSDQVTANHYLSDIVGLIYLGILCPFFKEADQWLEFGLQELWREMKKQVYEDGVDFEASISYHRLALELFLSPVILCKRNNIEVPGWVMARLEKMLDFVMHYTKPDGTVPLFGDCDNGRLHRLKVWADPDREWVDHRYLLAVGAVLFDRADFGAAAGDQWEEAFWLWGEQAIRYKEKLGKGDAAALSSTAFDKGGVYIMRGGSVYVAIDAGSNGQNGFGGHAHNDTLSFEYFAQGQSWVVDPGVYVYTADFDARNEHRSSHYHNVATVDAQEINRIEKEMLFFLSNDAHPQVDSWIPGPTYDRLTASHDGYARLTPPATITREFILDKPSGRLLVVDTLRCIGQHVFDAWLHFCPSEVSVQEKVAYVRPGTSPWSLGITTCGASGHYSLNVSTGWLAGSYGKRCAAPVLNINAHFVDFYQIAYLLTPFETGTPIQPAALLAEAEHALSSWR